MTAATSEINLNSEQKQAIADDYADFRGIAVRLKDFHKLSGGDIFKAQVMDIRSDRVTIRLASGGDITARSLILPDARIGDNAFFMVKENNKGQILLEMLRPQNAALIANIAKEALVSAGVYPTNENMLLVTKLIENNLPIDAASVQRAVFFRYSAAGLPVNHIVFLMKENFAMDTSNIETLGKLTDAAFAERLTDAFAYLNKLPEDIREEITQILKPVTEQTRAGNIREGDIPGLLSVLLKDKTALRSLPEYFKTLYTALKQTEAALARADGSTAETMKQAVSELAKQVEFMEHINNYKYYAQIPLIINDERQTAEIFVFKQPKKTPRLKDRANILIALDNKHIGRIETFIELNKKTLTLQFRAGIPDTLKLITQSIDTLTGAAAELGYNIGKITYKHITEPFTIADDMPVSDTQTAPPRRYAFDMRI